MSHLTHIKTQIKNAVVLEEVLNKMILDGLDGILSGAYLEHNTAIQDPFGNSKIAEFVIRREQSYQGGYDFGFKLIDSEFEFLSREGSNYEANQFIKQLTPWYAKENAFFHLAAQGFDIESYYESVDNQVKIIASRWA